jgi:hypothetical protein
VDSDSSNPHPDTDPAFQVNIYGSGSGYGSRVSMTNLLNPDPGEPQHCCKVMKIFTLTLLTTGTGTVFERHLENMNYCNALFMPMNIS